MMTITMPRRISIDWIRLLRAGCIRAVVLVMAKDRKDCENTCAACVMSVPGQEKSLPLRQTIRLLIAKHIQQFQRADFEIAAEAHIEADDVHLVQRAAVE